VIKKGVEVSNATSERHERDCSGNERQQFAPLDVRRGGGGGGGEERKEGRTVTEEEEDGG